MTIINLKGANNTETSIDRIERYIEEFTKGMLELKESQMKTDAQQNRIDVQLKETIKKSQQLFLNGIPREQMTEKAAICSLFMIQPSFGNSL